MQDPNEKTLDPIVSPLFVGAVHDALREYDGERLGRPRPCPRCESTDRRRNGYQRERKTVARLVTESGFEEIGVEVQQYECKACGHSFQGDLSTLFYDGCAYARPIVDLCRFHAADNSYHATERLLEELYGLQVDRDTIERYDERFDGTPDTDRAFAVGGELVSLPFLSFLFGEDDDSPLVLTSPTALW
jgi:transposase-like protein